MSYRSLSNGFTGKPNKSPAKLSYSRHHKPPARASGGGLDHNTVLEGSSIDVSPVSSSSFERKKSFGNSLQEDWREKYTVLQKTVQNLRKELKMKTKRIDELKEEKQSQQETHEREIENLKSAAEQKEEILKALQKESEVKCQKLTNENGSLEKKLENLSSDMNSLKTLQTETLSTIMKKRQEETQLLEKNHKKYITEIRRTHAGLLDEKDSIIEKLKAKVAVSFNEKSKERQIQIDELVKELKRVSDEAEYVKSALRKFKSTSDRECNKCNLYQDKFKEVSLELARKNSVCQDLYMVCSKMEKQLSQQGDLFQIWNTLKKEGK